MWMGEKEKKYWTVKQAASKKSPLNLSESTLRRMIRENKIAIKRVGSGRGCIRIPDAEIKKLIEPEAS